MGNTLKALKDPTKPAAITGMMQNSLSKIRELHGAFKSICDNFAMSITEFDQIFGTGESSFMVWDTDKNGIIDALELFSGLILFADARTEDKIRFLFDLFDFNELQSISKTDLEFLIFCCISSSFKVHGLADEIKEKSISEMVIKNFPDSFRITLRDLLHFCAHSEEVNTFFQFFRIRAISLPKPSTKKDIYQPLRKTWSYGGLEHSKALKELDNSMAGKIESNLRVWLGAVHAPLCAQHEKRQESRAKMGLAWVFGIRSDDTRHNIKCVPGQDIIIYFIASVVVVYYAKLLKQRHYLEHDHEVISLAVGSDDIACSGELGEHPKIHVWKISTLETLEVLSGVHQGAVPLLALSYSDQHIISCSIYSLVIYEWRTRSILITTHHNYPIVDLTVLPRLESSSACSFIVACEQDFTLYTIQESELNVSTLSLDASLTKSHITCAMGQVLYNQDPNKERTYILLTGHEDGSVLVWAYLEFQRVLITYEGSITSIERFYESYAIANSVGVIYLWDDKLEKCVRVIELSMLPFKLLSFEVSSMHFMNKRLYVSTTGGDLIQLRIIKEGYKLIAKRIPGIIPVPSKQRAITFLSTELPYLIIGGENGVVCVIDIRSYELMDAWAVGYSIYSLCCAKYEDHFFLAAGCESGSLLVRQDWDLVSTPQAGYDTITDVKFIKKGENLLASSLDSNVYVYKYLEGNYERIFIIAIDTGIPLTLDISKDGEHILIVTDKRKLMMMDGNNFDLNFTYQEVASVNWSRLRAFFPVHHAKTSDEKEYYLLPISWNSKADCIVAADAKGVIHFWKNASRVNDETGLLLPGHTSAVQDICLKSHILFTLGYEDRMIMQWKFEPCKTMIQKINSTSVNSILLTEIQLSCLDDKNKRKHPNQKLVQTAFLDAVFETSHQFFAQEDAQRPPSTTLKLKYIYGCQLNLRNSLHYVHIHTGDDTRPTCERMICYYVSRYGITFNPFTQSQSFYTFHEQRISALDVHQSQAIAATASNGIVHVWKVAGSSQISKLKSSMSGIYILRFGNNKQGGEILAVVGKEAEQHYIEIYDWKHENLITKACVGNVQVQDFQFHPTDLFNFAVCGVNHLSLWKRSGKFIKCKQIITVEKEFTCMQFLIFQMGTIRQEADLTIGSSQGELMLCVEGRLFLQVEQAHEGAIFCIKTTNYKGNDIILTSGQDGFVKIWTHGLKPINKFHISSINDSALSQMKSHFITNLQVYSCNSRKILDETLPKKAKLEALVILLGTSGGALMELNLSNIRGGDKMRLQYKVYVEGHCKEGEGSRKQLITIHPELNVVATVGDDSTLKVWDYEIHNLILTKQLDTDTRPSSVQFSKAGHLAIGMDNGILLILLSKHAAWGIGLKTAPEIVVIFSSRESNSAVLALEFSSNEEYLAVSYDNYRGQPTKFKADSTTVKTGGGAEILHGFVVLYQQADGAEGVTYRKISRIVLPFSHVKDMAAYPSRSECAVTQMEFSYDCMYLGLFHQKVKYREHLANPADRKPLLIIWDITSGEVVEDFENMGKTQWEKLIVQCLLYSCLKAGMDYVVNINTSSMVRDDMSMILGASNGQLQVVRIHKLAAEYLKILREHNETENEGLDLAKVGRLFFGHCSPVISAVLNKIQKYLFTTAMNEKCMMQWEVIVEHKHWEYEQLGYTMPSDPFQETLTSEQFTKHLTEVWIPRSELRPESEEAIQLKMESLAGRRAKDRRNNLKYESQERIVYVTGSNVIIYNKDVPSQTFLHQVTHSPVTSHAQISAFTLSPDRRLICYGTEELEACLWLWDLCAYVPLTKVMLPECCQVLIIKLSSNCRYAAAVCLGRAYQQFLFLVELLFEGKSQIIASAQLSPKCSFKVKDVLIKETDGLEIITCGIQHLVNWRLNGTHLEQYSAHLTTETEDYQVAFLTAAIMSEVLVTGADDGKVYIWKDEKLVKRVAGHEGCIYSIDTCEELSLITTGGQDGHIVVWKLTVKQSTFGYLAQLDSLREYSLNDPASNALSYGIQSLCIGPVSEGVSFKVLIGTQNGDIYELSYESNSDYDSLNRLLKSSDNQSIRSMSCDPTSNFIYTLSSSGFFAVWELSDFTMIHIKDYYPKKGVRVIAFQTKHYVLIAFDDELIVLKMSNDMEDAVNYEMLAGFVIQSRNITDACLSQDEKYLVVASNADQKPQVDLYGVAANSFALDKNLYGFRAPVIRLDFSTDGYYLMCEDNLGEVLLFELETQNIASLQAVEFEIEWQNEGLRHSSSLKGIYQLYRGNNKINCIAKNPALSIVAIGDQFGMIRFFQLPYAAGPTLLASTIHTYRISILAFTKNNEYLISYSELDRTFIKWKINS
ncbi:unnamed protein product [Blepharisma stoltei]|uniref:WD repeat-containing protein on Y chromosome n=1 Tax=Blepharisma stoltei TaxID=1481888 RepID=A0AAU9K7N4_9CILI|nr:unnamed protein product [Blepharisma stoltei]